MKLAAFVSLTFIATVALTIMFLDVWYDWFPPDEGDDDA
jgi:hypothetical protein